jgi:hypothetical protein
MLFAFNCIAIQSEAKVITTSNSPTRISAIAMRNVKTVHTFLRLFEEMNIPAWGDLWAEDGHQDMPYAPPEFPKTFPNKSEIMKHTSALPTTFEYMRFPDIVTYATTDPNVVIAQFRGDIKQRGSDRKYDNNYITIFRFRDDGKIISLVEYFNPLVLMQADAFTSGGSPRGAENNTNAAPIDPMLLDEWARNFFSIVDSRDTALISSFFSDDIRLTFGNRPVIVGREAAGKAFKSDRLKTVQHDIIGIWRGKDNDADVLSVEARVTYTLDDDSKVTVPCVSTLRLINGKIADYRIFIDPTPVFGPNP